jgi:hypothetical protein
VQKSPLGADLLHVTLGAHDDYNAASLEVVAAQELFLKGISDVDTSDVVRLTCTVICATLTRTRWDPACLCGVRLLLGTRHLRS